METRASQINPSNPLGLPRLSRGLLVIPLIACIGCSESSEKPAPAVTAAKPSPPIEVRPAVTEIPRAQREVTRSLLAPWQEMQLRANDECCSDPGEIADCWWQDALRDGVTYESDFDGTGGPDHCDIGYDGNAGSGQAADDSGDPRGPNGERLCQCSSNDECTTNICIDNLCRPDYCNGYMQCSCFGGCAEGKYGRLDSGGAAATPQEQCEDDSLICCQNDYPDNIDGNGMGYCADVCISSKIPCNNNDDCVAAGATVISLSPVMSPDCATVVCAGNECQATPVTATENDPCTNNVLYAGGAYGAMPRTGPADGASCYYAACNDTGKCEADLTGANGEPCDDDDGTICTISECDTGVCDVTAVNQPDGTVCYDDEDGCTVEECQIGVCTVIDTPCPEDSYAGEPNTCTLDCEDDDLDTTDLHICYVPLDEPSDSGAKPSTGICDYWDCEDVSGERVPVHHDMAFESECPDSQCAVIECDPSGAQGNCDDVTPINVGGACTEYDTDNACLEAECDTEGDCEDHEIAVPVDDPADCRDFTTCETATGVWNWVADDSELCTDSIDCTDDVCNAGTCDSTPNCDPDGPCLDYVCNLGPACDEDYTNFPNDSDRRGESGSCVKCDGDGTWSERHALCPEPAAPLDVCNDPLCLPDGTCDYETAALPLDCTPTDDPCEWECVDVAGVGDCQIVEGTSGNDVCAEAVSLFAFDGTHLDGQSSGEVPGNTSCALDDYQANGNQCFENARRLGANAKDSVFHFSYVRSAAGHDRYFVKVEAAFDVTIYAETGGCGGSGTDLACEYVNGVSGTVYEDQCGAPYDCGTGHPGMADVAVTTVKEDTSQAAGSTVDVYIYVDGAGAAPGTDGEFYISVTKETGCPDVASWYRGTVNTSFVHTDGNPYPIVINGETFIDGGPISTRSGSLGGTFAILLEGDTSGLTNGYDGPGGGNANDELWELSVSVDDAWFNATLCDYGGNASFNSQLALFNCYGELIRSDDDGCGGGGESEIQPTGMLQTEDTPHYLLVDGHSSTGDYDLALYYDPSMAHIICETDASGNTEGRVQNAITRSSMCGNEDHFLNNECTFIKEYFTAQEYCDNCYVCWDCGGPCCPADPCSLSNNQSIVGKDVAFHADNGIAGCDITDCIENAVLHYTLYFEDTEGNPFRADAGSFTGFNDHLNLLAGGDPTIHVPTVAEVSGAVGYYGIALMFEMPSSCPNPDDCYAIRFKADWAQD